MWKRLKKDEKTIELILLQVNETQLQFSFWFHHHQIVSLKHLVMSPQAQILLVLPDKDCVCQRAKYLVYGVILRVLSLKVFHGRKLKEGVNYQKLNSK